MTKSDYVVAPGEFLEEWMEDEGYTVAQTAESLRWEINTVEEFIKGGFLMTNKRALELWELTTIPINTWLKYEALYHNDLNRLREIQANQ